VPRKHNMIFTVTLILEIRSDSSDDVIQLHFEPIRWHRNRERGNEWP
jgi:hypothetical protein